VGRWSGAVDCCSGETWEAAGRGWFPGRQEGVALSGMAIYIAARSSGAPVFAKPVAWVSLGLFNLAAILGTITLDLGMSDGSQEYREWLWWVRVIFLIGAICSACGIAGTIAAFVFSLPLHGQNLTTLGGAHDVRPQVAHARIGATLQPQDLLDIRDTLARARAVRRTLLRLAHDVPRLAEVGPDHRSACIRSSDVATMAEPVAEAVGRVGAQEYVVEQRMTVYVAVRANGSLFAATWALNEARVEKAARERMVEVITEVGPALEHATMIVTATSSPVPVIGDGLRDGESGPAAGAVDEWIPVAPICVVKELSQARGADGHVRGDERLQEGSFPAFLDPELGIALHRTRLPRQGLDQGERRGLVLYAPQEPFEALRRSFHLHTNALGVVADRSRQTMPASQGVDEGPKPHSLHDALHRYPSALEH